MASEGNDNDEHEKAFGRGVHTISDRCKDDINKIKGNDPTCKYFTFKSSGYAFSNSGLALLGRYIAANEYLERVTIFGWELALSDAQVPLLLKEAMRPLPLKELHFDQYAFGLDGVKSIASFLKNCQNLTSLEMSEGSCMDTKCFGLIINALSANVQCIKVIRFYKCIIDDITVLGHCTLSTLSQLDLNSNRIHTIPSLEHYVNLESLSLEGSSVGNDGCRKIGLLLQNRVSKLKRLNLISNKLNSEGIEILANSLKHNTVLEDLHLGGSNNCDEAGYRAFLKLLNDVSSIKATVGSNHTLRGLQLPISSFSSYLLLCMSTQDSQMEARQAEKRKYENMDALTKHIDSAVEINFRHRRGWLSTDPRRVKVIETQLSSTRRRELCQLQGIHYSYESIFADIEHSYLPNMLAIVGKEYGKNEFYHMLLVVGPDLSSLINRKRMMKEMIAKNKSRITTLIAEAALVAATNKSLIERLALIESGESNDAMNTRNKIMDSQNRRGRKRCRSSSF